MRKSRYNSVEEVEEALDAGISAKSDLEKLTAKVNKLLSDISPLIEALERMIAVNGVTDDDRAMAQSRIAIRCSSNANIILEGGNGSMKNPANWKYGSAVVSGLWYKTPSEYIWKAVNDGVPASETDKEYFDVVGLD